MSENTIKIFTDGACKGNPGLGGWGALIIENGEEKEIYGGSFNTTNNKMELTATIEALKFYKDPKTIELYTDSKYVKDGITEWIINWKKNGWKNPPKEKTCCKKNQTHQTEVVEGNTLEMSCGMFLCVVG